MKKITLIQQKIRVYNIKIVLLNNLCYNYLLTKQTDLAC